MSETYCFTEGSYTRSLWMGSLDPDMDERSITLAFDRMGVMVEQVKFVNDRLTRARINSYCFVQFKDSEAAENAVKRLNGKPIPNFTHIKFNLAPSRNGNERDTRKREFSLFVGNLSDDVDENSLSDFFGSRYPTMKEARLCRDHGGMSKGFGFVRFFNESDQLEALRRMNGVRGLGNRSIYVSQATPKTRYRESTNAELYPSQHQDTPEYYNQQYVPSQYTNPYHTGDTWSTGEHHQQQDHHQQYPPQSFDYNTQEYDLPGTSQSQTIQNEEDGIDNDDELADHGLHINVDKLNEEFIQNNEEFYSSLEKSRWLFIDSVMSIIDRYFDAQHGSTANNH